MYETATVISAIVAPTSSMPVTEKSFWVMPCWTRSPIITSMIRSNGCSDEQLAPADDARQQEDEREADGGADDEIHQG